MLPKFFLTPNFAKHTPPPPPPRGFWLFSSGRKKIALEYSFFSYFGEIFRRKESSPVSVFSLAKFRPEKNDFDLYKGFSMKNK
jgi:hypothetical protein